MNSLRWSCVLLLFSLCISCHETPSEVISDFGIHKTSDKVWAHRVNSVHDNYNKLDEFKGIEIDIFYEPDKGNFIVKHDIEDLGADLGLFLDSVLIYNKTPIWIDYKNMNIETEAGIKKLRSILSSKDLLEKSFVESYYLGALKKAKGRLLTSFWTGSHIVPESRAGQDSLFNADYNHLNLSDFTMLSASHNMFEFFAYYFPEVKCNYWLSGTLNTEGINRVNEIASAPNTNVILIDGDINYLK